MSSKQIIITKSKPADIEGAYKKIDSINKLVGDLLSRKSALMQWIIEEKLKEEEGT